MDKILQFTAITLILIFSYLEGNSQCDSIRTIQIDSCEYVALPTDLFVSFYLIKNQNENFKNNLKILRNEIGSLRLRCQYYEESSDALIDSILKDNLELKQSNDSYSLNIAKANGEIIKLNSTISRVKKQNFYYLGVGFSIGILLPLILK